MRMDTGFSISIISTHAPAGGATIPELIKMYSLTQFLLTPLREGRLYLHFEMQDNPDFYSRPCGRGD